jgi:hypothetical protein
VDDALPPAVVGYEPEPVEGYVDDALGHHEISLLVRDGYLRGLELVTYSTRPATDWPDLAAMQIMVFEESPWRE